MKRILAIAALLTFGIIFFTEIGFGQQGQVQPMNKEKNITTVRDEEFLNKDKYLEAEKLYEQGKEYLKTYKYENAIIMLNKGLAIYQEIGYKKGEADCLLGLGEVHYMLNEYDKAKEKYEQGLVIFREIKDRLSEANCLLRLGEVHGILNEYDKAKEKYEQGLVIYRQIKKRLGEANCLLGLGEVHRMLDEYGKAREKYEQGLVIYRQIKDRLGQANCLYCLGDVHRMLNEYDKARERYEQGLGIYREIKNRLGEANCLQSLGEVHMKLDEYEKARDYYNKGLDIFRNIKDRLGEANCLQSLGEVHGILNEYDKAKERYEQGLSIFREIKDRLGQAHCLQSLGVVHMSLLENEKARERYEQALAICRAIKYRLGEANCLYCLGEVHRILAENDEAIKYYKNALPIQKEINDRHEMCWTFYRLGQTYEAMYKFAHAEKEYINSIDSVENVLEAMKHEEFKSSYLVSNIFPYEDLICLLFKLNKGKQAYSYAERAKARSFLYLLGNKRFDIKKGVPLNLIRQEEELRQKIAGLTVQIEENEKKEQSKPFSTEKFIEIRNELKETKKAYDELIEKIKFQCPEYANLITVNPLSLKQIQTLIRKSGDTVFIEYYTTLSATYLWVLDGKDIFPYKIDIDYNTLNNKIVEFYNMITTPGQFNVRTLEFQAQAIYNLLLKPAESHWMGKKRVGVIPHDFLHYLPFEALMNNGKFLEEQNIHFFYLPSASVYAYCREKNSLKKEQLVAFGNPDGSLIFSEIEVQKLKELYNFKPRIFIGREATENQVITEGPNADILHFSCHGIFDASNPLHSALELGADSNADGSLEVKEIFQLNLKPAYLVTLSACDTNVGKIRNGDEITVMSRAFLYAGTPSVLASLWKVDALESTEKLMVSFYRELKEKNKIEALHSARMEMINSGKRHPYYWAPFVLIGDFR